MKIGRLVYLVQHVSREGQPEEDVKCIGVFSSRKLAEHVVSDFKKLPGFKRYPNAFYITKTPLNSTAWESGFVTKHASKPDLRANGARKRQRR